MKYIEVILTKCRLYLTEAEIITLLATAPPLWAEAIRRGKAITRAEREQVRQERRAKEC